MGCGSSKDAVVVQSPPISASLSQPASMVENTPTVQSVVQPDQAENRPPPAVQSVVQPVQTEERPPPAVQSVVQPVQTGDRPPPAVQSVVQPVQTEDVQSVVQPVQTEDWPSPAVRQPSTDSTHKAQTEHPTTECATRPKRKQKLSREIIHRPSCSLHVPRKFSLPRISSFQLAEHNAKCKHSELWTDLWARDRDYVYNGHALYRYFKPMTVPKLEEAQEYNLTLFHLYDYHVPLEQLNPAKCMSIVGVIDTESEETEVNRQRQLLELVQSDLVGNSDSEDSYSVCEDFAKLIERHLERLKTIQPQQCNKGDLNVEEFILPQRITPNDLRTWLTSWQQFDFDSGNDGNFWNITEPENFQMPDTHEYFAQMVAGDRQSVLDTAIDGDVAWCSHPENVIKDDIITDNQLELLQSRENRAPLSFQGRINRHHQILSHLSGKYLLDEEKVERCRNWVQASNTHWDIFQKLCDTWTEDQRPPIILRPTTQIVHDRRKLDRECKDEEKTIYGIWNELISDKPKSYPEPSHGKMSVLFGTQPDYEESHLVERNTVFKRGKAAAIIPRKPCRITEIEDTELLKDQLDLLKQDIINGQHNCGSWQENVVKCIDQYTHTTPNHSVCLGEDPNQKPYQLPLGTEPGSLRPFITQNSAKMTVYQHSTKYKTNTLFDVLNYADPKTKVLSETRESQQQSEAEPIISQGRRTISHRCCRSPDLRCVDCRGPVIVGAKISSPWACIPVGPGIYHTTPLTTSEPPPPPTPAELEKMVQRRAAILTYYARSYNYTTQLDPYRGWADRMQEAWVSFQALCDQ